MITLRQLTRLLELIFQSGLTIDEVEQALQRKLNEKRNEQVELAILEGTYK